MYHYIICLSCGKNMSKYPCAAFLDSFCSSNIILNIFIGIFCHNYNLKKMKVIMCNQRYNITSTFTKKWISCYCFCCCFLLFFFTFFESHIGIFIKVVGMVTKINSVYLSCFKFGYICNQLFRPKTFHSHCKWPSLLARAQFLLLEFNLYIF